MKTNENIEKEIVQSVKYWNRKTEGMPTTRKVAKRLGMKATELYKLLRQKGVLTVDDMGYWFCGRYKEMELALMRQFLYYNDEGELSIKQYPVWTERGVEFLKQIGNEQRGC